jgi:hypothetical protein
VNDGELFAFAGLRDGWKNPERQWIKTCSILTTTPTTFYSLQWELPGVPQWWSGFCLAFDGVLGARLAVRLYLGF